MIRDLRLASRMLLKDKRWTLVVLVSLALGIGVNTTLFTGVNGLLLRTISVHEPEELVRLRWVGDNEMATSRYEYGYVRPGADGRRVLSTFSHPIYEQLRAGNETLTDLVACAPAGRVNLAVKGQAELASTLLVSGNYFEVLGVPAHIGRTLEPADDRRAATGVAVISHRYWVRRFGSSPDVVGMDVLVNGTPVKIVGVTPPEYQGIQRLGQSARDLHLPLVLDDSINDQDRLGRPTFWWLQIVGRLKPGVSPAQVKGNLNGIFQQAARAGWESHWAGLSQEERNLTRNRDRAAVPELDVASAARGVYDQSENTTRTISILAVVVVIILLIVCANVANLLLSRATLRQKEISIRLSLGAGRLRLVRQLLTESVLLSLLGAALGLVLAFWSRRLLPAGEESPLDWRVFAFTAAIGVLTGVAFGIIPALRTTSVDLAGAVKSDSRTISSSRTLFSKGLLVTQVAMSLALLVGAALFLRTLQNLRAVDVGFNPRNVLLVSVDADLIQYDEDRAERLYEEIRQELGTLPGVLSVSMTANPLLSGSTWISTVHVAEGESDDGESAHMMTVSPEFFTTFEIPVLVGRGFTRQDDDDAPEVAVINQTAARNFFGEDHPVGRRFGFSPENRNDIEVIGVIADTKYSSVRDDAPPTVYRPYRQNRFSSPTFAIRTGLQPQSLVPAVREAVRRIDPNLPLTDISTQADEVEERHSRERFFARAFSLFGALALLLACIGLFGLMSYSVVRRTNEIGIRMALGARPRRIVGMVLGESMVLVLIGCAIGLAVTWAAGRFVATLLFGLAPADLASIAGALVMMALVSALAGYLPARRASQVDPMIALRYE